MPGDILMTLEELEDKLSTYKIMTPKFRSKTVENRSLPSMLSTFRELIKDEVPPTQNAFINNFKKKYPELVNRGVLARLRRAYLSYVREYHLGYLLKNHFTDVIYDEKTDLLGVDYVIYYRDHKFNIHAFVNTQNGQYWRSIKNDRHNFVGHHLDLPMNLENGKHVGKFILYTDNDIVTLKNSMDEIINNEEIN